MATTQKKVEKPEQKPTEILDRALEGRASLEYYPEENRTIVAIKCTSKVTFWIEFDELKQMVADFDEVINLRLKK